MIIDTNKMLSKSSRFDKILTDAKNWESKLSGKRREELTSRLSHGAARLDNQEELLMYLVKYGQIHQAKLLKSFEKIPLSLWQTNAISVVDYGCGQGIGEIVLSDFMYDKSIDINYISEIKLFDPSIISIYQAEYFSKFVFPFSNICAFTKRIEDIREDDIKTSNKTVLHIFSNIIDLFDLKFDAITDVLSRDKNRNNVIVCISPYYQEKSRGKRMHEFGEKLKGYYRLFCLEKHIDEWDEGYSCQIHIYISGQF